jgi:cytochrome d ubiquinol oxidase subunit I
LLGTWLWWRYGRTLPEKSWFLRLLVWNAPLGVLAMEAGWIVTEVGRQPWIIQGVMQTRAAVTKMSGLWVTCVLFLAIYAFLGVVVYALMKKQVFASLDADGEA